MKIISPANSSCYCTANDLAPVFRGERIPFTRGKRTTTWLSRLSLISLVLFICIVYQLLPARRGKKRRRNVGENWKRTSTPREGRGTSRRARSLASRRRCSEKPEERNISSLEIYASLDRPFSSVLRHEPSINIRESTRLRLWNPTRPRSELHRFSPISFRNLPTILPTDAFSSRIHRTYYVQRGTRNTADEFPLSDFCLLRRVYFSRSYPESQVSRTLSR